MGGKDKFEECVVSNREYNYECLGDYFFLLVLALKIIFFSLDTEVGCVNKLLTRKTWEGCNWV